MSDSETQIRRAKGIYRTRFRSHRVSARTNGDDSRGLPVDPVHNTPSDRPWRFAETVSEFRHSPILQSTFDNHDVSQKT